MAEVVGVVAAAAQLTGACLSLIQLTERIKGASSMLSNYQSQFQELHNLSISIAQNPLLQTEEIFSHTQSLLSFIRSSSLELHLQRGLISRTWYLIRREKQLAETASSLERRKSSLSLTINDIQARALYDIRSNVKQLSDTHAESTLCGLPSSEVSGASNPFYKDPKATGQNPAMPPPNSHAKRQPRDMPPSPIGSAAPEQRGHGETREGPPHSTQSATSQDGPNQAQAGDNWNFSEELDRHLLDLIKNPNGPMHVVCRNKAGPGLYQDNGIDWIGDDVESRDNRLVTMNVAWGNTVQNNACNSSGRDASSLGQDAISSDVPSGTRSTSHPWTIVSNNIHHGLGADFTGPSTLPNGMQPAQLNGRRIRPWDMVVERSSAQPRQDAAETD